MHHSWQHCCTGGPPRGHGKACAAVAARAGGQCVRQPPPSQHVNVAGGKAVRRPPTTHQHVLPRHQLRRGYGIRGHCQPGLGCRELGAGGHARGEGQEEAGAPGCTTWQQGRHVGSGSWQLAVLVRAGHAAAAAARTLGRWWGGGACMPGRPHRGHVVMEEQAARQGGWQWAVGGLCTRAAAHLNEHGRLRAPTACPAQHQHVAVAWCGPHHHGLEARPG